MTMMNFPLTVDDRIDELTATRSLLRERLGGKPQPTIPAIPHPRLEVREIVSPGAPEAVGQIRIGFVGGGRAGKYTR